MRKLFFLIVLLAGAMTVHAQRINTTINTGWYFHKGDVAPTDRDFTSSAWERVNLPHTWNQSDAFDEEKGYYRGLGWYAYSFVPSPAWTGKRVILHFEGANQQAEVFVNEHPVGSHTGGYTAFNFDITEHLRPGERNTIRVRLDNSHNRDIPPLNADFTFYGGIYRNVRIIAVDPVHFDLTNCASEGVFVQTPSVSAEQATLFLQGEVVNSDAADKKLVLETVLLDDQNREVATQSRKITVKAATKFTFRSDPITVSQPRLWSPETPYLYKAVVRISEVSGKKASRCDEVVVPVGLRWYEFDGKDGFKLNGKKYCLRGANRHQDFALMGNALTDEFHRNDYRKIKELGFNFVRLAHYPQSPEVYRTCDELGLLVWTEIPVVNEVTDTQTFTDNCLTMMREQIRQTRNHPSVILYGYMNEILIKMLSNRKLTEQQRTHTAAVTRSLAVKLDSLSKAEAPERPTVMAVHYEEGYNHYGVADVPDVIGYNLYFGWYYETLEDLTRHLSAEHARYPERPIIVSEFGPGADVRNHSLVPMPWDFSEEYQIIMHTSYLDQMARLDWLAGYTLWNFADFGAENRADALPWINQKGLVNYDRTEKDVTGLYRAANLTTPVLQIASRNYTVRCAPETQAGSGICVNPITVFSNGKQVELSLNGVSLGSKAVSSRQVCFDVPFADGVNVLEARDDSGLSDILKIDFTVLPLDLRAWNGDYLAVSVGSYQTFVEPRTHTVWMPDREYTPGSWGRIGGAVFEKRDRQLKVGISNNILGTECNPLYQTFVQDIEGYRFDVADGTYCVTLCFMENNPKSPAEDIIYNLSNTDADSVPAGVREFSVSVNGAEAISGLNLARDYGNLRAVQFDVTAQARNGSGIEVSFRPQIGKTTLSGIRIRRL